MRSSLIWIALGVLCASGARAEVGKGKRAVDFNLTALDGKKVSLAAHKGKVVLLDFWASWCAPCKQELPELERLKQAYEGKGVVFITINIDKERSNAAQIVERLKLTLPVALDPEGTVAEQYELPTMPTSFVIDRAGIVRHIHEGFRGAEDIGKFKRELDELLAAK
ncbi:MAG: TlpA family protein disulfide reductase [Myxococcales bacterium]|nr:TlpA family protein disulfide reductase [Myxococcales bacterium]